MCLFCIVIVCIDVLEIHRIYLNFEYRLFICIFIAILTCVLKLTWFQTIPNFHFMSLLKLPLYLYIALFFSDTYKDRYINQ